MASLTTSIHQLRQAAVGACLSYLLVAGSITCTSLPELLLPGAVLDRFASAVFLFVFLVFFFPPPLGARLQNYERRPLASSCLSA